MRTLLRLIIVIVVLAVAASFFFGYRWGSAPWSIRSAVGDTRPIGTSGRDEDRRERAREVGAQVGATISEGAARAEHALDEGRITAKVKSKLALDDTLKGSHVEVHTDDHAVTLSGEVMSASQHQRALQLARETDGVTTVVDRMSVRGR